jgi:YD repeat-containing protein
MERRRPFDSNEGQGLEEQRGFHMSGTTPVTYTVGYAYDALDRTTVITYPDGEVVTQTYDNRGLPLALIGDSDYVTQTVRRRRLTTQPGR